MNEKRPVLAKYSLLSLYEAENIENAQANSEK